MYTPITIKLNIIKMSKRATSPPKKTTTKQQHNPGTSHRYIFTQTHTPANTHSHTHTHIPAQRGWIGNNNNNDSRQNTAQDSPPPPNKVHTFKRPELFPRAVLAK